MSQIVWRPVVLPSIRLERVSVNGVTDCENIRSMTCDLLKIQRPDDFFVYLELNPVCSTIRKIVECDDDGKHSRRLCLRQRASEVG